MSYNVSHIEVHESNLWLSGKELRQLYAEHQDNLPECHLFEGLDLLRSADDQRVPIKTLDWAGTWSGNSFSTFEKILKQLHGQAKFSVVWEDGETEYYRLWDSNLETVEVKIQWGE